MIKGMYARPIYKFRNFSRSRRCPTFRPRGSMTMAILSEKRLNTRSKACLTFWSSGIFMYALISSRLTPPKKRMVMRCRDCSRGISDWMDVSAP